MKCIALTGGIGAGKSAAAAEFARLGAEVIDADKISRRIMLPGESAYSARESRSSVCPISSRNAIANASTVSFLGW